MKKQPIVTKEYIAQQIKTRGAMLVIGRALSAIYRRQTDAEQSQEHTITRNGVGFAKPDARIGSIGARQFNKDGTMQQWIVDIWMREAADKFPRICKYANQLNDIAVQKSLIGYPMPKIYSPADLQSNRSDKVHTGAFAFLNDNVGDDPVAECSEPHY